MLFPKKYLMQVQIKEKVKTIATISKEMFDVSTIKRVRAKIFHNLFRRPTLHTSLFSHKKYLSSSWINHHFLSFS